MKRTASVLILVLGASIAYAQTVNPVKAMDSAKNAASQASAASTGAKQPAGALAGTAAAPASKANSLGDAAKQVAKPIASGTPKSTANPATKAAPAMDAKTAAPASATPAKTQSYSSAGKRDPFVSPIVNRVAGPTGCSGGKKCLVIDQVALKGVVKSPNGMIAVIVNTGNKTYFMRENDPVWNGFVVKITADSVVFRETVTDRVGKTSTRDIVKRVTAPAV